MKSTLFVMGMLGATVLISLLSADLTPAFADGVVPVLVECPKDYGRAGNARYVVYPSREFVSVGAEPDRAFDSSLAAIRDVVEPRASLLGDPIGGDTLYRSSFMLIGVKDAGEGIPSWQRTGPILRKLEKVSKALGL